jgi:Ser/Thr protein kinase RdoA (MazF antagonist)
MDTTGDTHTYQRLTPNLILGSLEALGFPCDGRLLALNSYENRVYQVGIEDDAPVIAKFYRPQRWSRAAIQEEHDFTLELAAREIPVVAPYRNAAGASVHQQDGFLFAVYPRCGGRWPDLDSRDQRLQMGRFLGRLHAVGAAGRFRYRERVDSDTLGHSARNFILEQQLVPAYLLDAYASLTTDLLHGVESLFAAAGNTRLIRLHGDCHPGNILWTDTGPHFVDLDDSRSGPAIQDIWMLLSGERDEMRMQLGQLLEGYQTFCDFDSTSVLLIEALRTLRIMNYAAWIARRWDDPAFPLAFPWYASPRYWEEHILSLREQADALNQPALL